MRLDSQQELAKDIFWAIICELRSQNVPELADALWTNICKDDSGLPVILDGPVADERARIISTVYHPDILGWVIDVAMEKGYLWCARRVTGAPTAEKPLSCVFDCDGPGYILKPSTDSTIVSSSRNKSLYMPISWAVNRSGQMFDGAEILIGRDLVRGFWATNEASSLTYVLV